MGAEAGWEPIKVYASLDGLDPDNLSREQIKQKLDAASPDAVRRAGRAFLDAAELVGGKAGGNGASEMGIQAALSRTAKELAGVWRGPAAEKVQSALRALYATAGALGDAMTASGVAMSWYADVVSEAKTNFPAAPDSSAGSGGSGGRPSASPSPSPSYSASPQSRATPAPSPGPAPYPNGDEAARAHFRKLNRQIQEANNAFAEGLAFELPAIEPLDIDLTNSPRINVGGTGAPETRSDGVWHGGSYGNGTAGSGTGSAGGGHTGGGSGTVGSGGSGGSGVGGTGPGGSGAGGTGTGSTGPGGTDASGGTGDPGTALPSPDPGGSADTGQTGTGQTGGSGDDPGTAPPVIGGSDRTDLASTHPLPGTTPGGTTPAGTTPNALTGYPDPRVPFTTGGPTGALPPGGVIGGYGGPRTGYGIGVAAFGEGPALLSGYRPGQSGAGSAFLPYAPAAGGAGTSGQDEREREIYDPEPDVWQVTNTISPHQIG